MAELGPRRPNLRRGIWRKSQCFFKTSNYSSWFWYKVLSDIDLKSDEKHKIERTSFEMLSLKSLLEGDFGRGWQGWPENWKHTFTITIYQVIMMYSIFFGLYRMLSSKFWSAAWGEECQVEEFFLVAGKSMSIVKMEWLPLSLWSRPMAMMELSEFDQICVATCRNANLTAPWRLRWR